MKKKNSIYLAIDFDGTVVTHEYPRVGKDVGAVPVLKKLIAAGHKLILFTMRADKMKDRNSSTLLDNVSSSEYYLTEAVNWFKANDIPLYGIQTNPTQRAWTTSPKAYANLYIDDAAINCPLIDDKSISDRPFVDWVRVEEELIKKELI